MLGDKGAAWLFRLELRRAEPGYVKAVEIDGGGGCVAPSKETVQDKTYKPLARPLFIYVKNSSYKDNAAVRSYVDFYIENEAKVAEEALFVGLTPEQKKTCPGRARIHRLTTMDNVAVTQSETGHVGSPRTGPRRAQGRLGARP